MIPPKLLPQVRHPNPLEMMLFSRLLPSRQSHQFSLYSLFVVVTFAPICVGIVTSIATHAFTAVAQCIGWGWREQALNLLSQDTSLPHGFIYGYVAPTMLCVPAWLCFCCVVFAIGLLNAKWATPVAVTFLLSIPVAYAIPECFTGHLFQLNHRVVPFVGMLLATGSFFAARRLAGQALVSAAICRIPVFLLFLVSAIALFFAFNGWQIIGGYGKH